MNWYDDSTTVVDQEYKITEFDYENHIAPQLIPKDATESKEFKRLIRALNLLSQTKYEKLQANKEDFKQLMPLLRGLTPEEQEIFIHKLENSGRTLGDDTTSLILDEMTQKNLEQRLAKLSEEENFNAKNRYRLQRKTLDYADKSRMPIDESKLKDVLKNQATFKVAINKEIGTYD